MIDQAELHPRLACPRCHSPLRNDADELRCTNTGCGLRDEPFPQIDDVPILVDFETSILDRKATLSHKAASPAKSRNQGALRRALIAKLLKNKRESASNVASFLAACKQVSAEPLILVIGGGEIGEGARLLYDDPSVKLVGSDIYLSSQTQLIADGHQLPFQTGSFHGVWIQAVLEHVLDPGQVVKEIHRILVDGGIVYAETPFMQQVHEGAYDFTRFSLSGHRWLFRGFSNLASGITRGPSTVLLWSIRYFVASLFGSYKAGTAASLAFFWVRYLDRFSKSSFAIDGASGVWFLGKREVDEIKPRDVVAYYSGAQ